MTENEHVVELLEKGIAIYTALRDFLLQGKITVVGILADTDGSRPDHYVFQHTDQGGRPPKTPDTPDELIRAWNEK